MSWSQVFLILALVMFLVYIFRLRSEFSDRILFAIGALTGIVFVIYPDLTTWIANQVGIGRGTDLIFYIFIVLGLFFVPASSARHRRLERQLTQIVRNLAIDHPQHGDGWAKGDNG